MEERLRKQKEFILEVDKMKQIYRQTHIRGYERQENDAEHFLAPGIDGPFA